ncbi:MAG: hypothetical protein EON97_00110 [Chitinophagaceae bacterium]|nr:MAG: hypothetical protein EON97_00110 [Chitinophagaceae bacterium]
MKDRLYESLFILDKCCATILRLSDAIEENQTNETRRRSLDLHIVDLGYYMIMETVSFLDEYNGAFINNVEAEFRERIMTLRKIATPIIKKITRWKDLEKFRNNIVAHPWRKDGRIALPTLSNYNVPSDPLDFHILSHLIHYFRQLLHAEFSTEMEEADHYVRTLANQPDPPPPDYSSLNTEHIELKNVVNELAKEKNRSYGIKIFLYYLDDEPDGAEYDKYGNRVEKN